MAPLYSFTGLDWWTIFTQSWDRLAAHDNFRDMDYLIPTISSDFTGLIPRPGQADRTLRWLKDALHRQGTLETSTFRQLSWHSFRVFIPDCAYQLGMPRDQRQYLGNWSKEPGLRLLTNRGPHESLRAIGGKTWAWAVAYGTDQPGYDLLGWGAILRCGVVVSPDLRFGWTPHRHGDSSPIP